MKHGRVCNGASPFCADGIVYVHTMSNDGYSGDLEVALVPEWFRIEFLREVLGSNSALVERDDDIAPVYVALFSDFDEISTRSAVSCTTAWQATSFPTVCAAIFKVC